MNQNKNIMNTLKKALEYIRENIEIYDLYHMRINAMTMRCSFSSLYPRDADDIADALEEYGQDNDLPEGWWCEYGDIDDIIEML